MEAEKGKEPGKAAPWLAMLADAEEADREYQARCDNTDKLYGEVKKGADENVNDREMRLFWANLQVLMPTIYSRPPIPMVQARFKDREPLPRAAADLIERNLLIDVDRDGLHETLKLARNDLARNARGVVWLRLATDRRGDVRAMCDHVSRTDFRHGPARNWRETPWVARRAYLTREELERRFGRQEQAIEYRQRRLGRDDEKGQTGKDAPGGGESAEERKAEVWEIWHKGKGRVVWVAMGSETVLDERDPPYDLEGFWPCPMPAYGTIKPETLHPVPDVAFYKDQLEEINELTARMADLCDALRVKGFYDSGDSDIGTAVEIAMAKLTNRAVLIPVSTFAAHGGRALSDAIVWLPIDTIAQVIRECVANRRVLIEDVYEITGLSDIMRGATAASETATAQQLKAQFGSVRVRERQDEMARLARDILRIKAELLAEHGDVASMVEAAQMGDALPSRADLEMQAAQMAQAAQMGDENAAAQLEAMQAEMAQAVTLEDVEALLRDQRMRPFVLDVQTDSTIQPDENAEKQRRIEFVTAVGGLMQQALPAVQAMPQLGGFVAETLRFAASGFRAGRQMDAAVDELAEMLAAMAQQPAPQGDGAAEAEAQRAQAEAQIKAQEAEMKAQEAQARLQIEGQKAQADAQAKAVELQQRGRETDARIALIGAQIEKINAEIGRIGAQAAVMGREPANGDG